MRTPPSSTSTVTCTTSTTGTSTHPASTRPGPTPTRTGTRRSSTRTRTCTTRTTGTATDPADRLRVSGRASPVWRDRMSSRVSRGPHVSRSREAMMRIARVLAATTLLLGTAFVAGPAGATSRPAPPSPTVTTTTRVAAICTVQPPISPPRTQEYTVTVTVPRRVAPGSQAEIGVTVDYPVVATATAGAISVRVQQTGDT